MAVLHFFAERLGEINHELGLSSASGFLEQTQHNLKKEADNKELVAALITADSPIAEVRALKEKWVKESNLQIQQVNFSSLFRKSLNDLFPALAICLLDEELIKQEQENYLSLLLKEQYKCCVIINFLSTADRATSLSRDLVPSIHTLVLQYADVKENSLKETLESWLPPQKIEALKKLSSLNTVKPVINLLNQVFTTENKAIQVRKMIGTQNQTITRKEEQSASQIELMNTIRQTIQKHTNDIDKNLKFKYDDLQKPNTGEFSKTVETLANNHIDFKRVDMAEKSEKVDIKITEDFEENFFHTLKTKQSEEMNKDAGFVKLATTELVNRVNNLLATKNLNPLSLQNQFPEFPDHTVSFKSYMQFNREFYGELMKKGPMEYFVALRDYTGVIMVATGLLAPLTIIASISENGFLKHLSNGVKFGMAAITLFLIVYGIYDLRKRIPRKRKEEFEKEIKKSREFLTLEGKRIISDVSKDWLYALNNWIREAGLVISNAFEKNMKDALMQKQNQLQKDKVQQQRQQLSLETHQRNTVTAEKIKDMMVTKWREGMLEAENSFNN